MARTLNKGPTSNITFAKVEAKGNIRSVKIKRIQMRLKRVGKINFTILPIKPC